MNQNEKVQILKVFVSSEEMTEYLMSADLPVQTLAYIIAGAPVPLSVKSRYAWGEDKAQIKRALFELTLRPGEVFSLTDNGMTWILGT